MARAVSASIGGAVRYTVMSDGAAINPLFQLLSFTIRNEVNRIGKALLVFRAGDMPNATIPESEESTFLPGKSVSIAAGYGDDEEVLFEGVVVSHSVRVLGANDTTLEVECRHYAVQTTQSRFNRVFNDKTDSDIIATLLGAYSQIDASVASTSAVHPEVVQHCSTDWDFITSRADANGLVIITDGKAVRVARPDVSGAPTVRVTYGIDLLEFHGELNAAGQQDQVSALGWDPATQSTVETQSASPTLNDQGDIDQQKLAAAIANTGETIFNATSDQATLQAWADAKVLRLGLSRIRGTCKFNGDAGVVLGGLLELEGLGSRFNGNAYVGAVEHTLDETGWYTTVQLGLDSDDITQLPAVTVPPAFGFVPGVHGLCIGVVSKLDADPSNEYRIQVELPMYDKSNQLIWARLAQGWASDGFGLFHMPEVGDEVVLGFLGGDPAHAIVLGSLYSSKRKPAYEITAENTIRAITTRSGIVIELDEENKVVTVKTPAG
ncbi:type VI secretion system tip protein VgrG, partial [Parapedobacter pyrenivorans]|uniref:type VI secretion system tip protein VgrG n=1 Tax=Parapedobacter pyrenivorans TaxID=1305674 RepID=UPI0033420E66